MLWTYHFSWDKGRPEKKAWLNVYIHSLKKKKKSFIVKKKMWSLYWTKCELYYGVNGFTIWKGEKTTKKGGLVVLGQTQECSTRGIKVRSVVTSNNNNYGSIQHFLAGEYPNGHTHGVCNNSRPHSSILAIKKRGGGWRTVDQLPI